VKFGGKDFQKIATDFAENLIIKKPSERNRGGFIESCVNCFMSYTWPMRKARSSPTSFSTRTSNDCDGLAPGGQIGALVAAHLHRVDPSFHHPSIEAFRRKRRSFI
jgi:hypothetical protein